MNAEKGWIIDVCATCHRHATWPFCEHRRTDRQWTVAVPVKATQAGLTALRAAAPTQENP